MTITPGNQPHTPRLQIDLDEIVSTIIMNSPEYRPAGNARHPFPAWDR